MDVFNLRETVGDAAKPFREDCAGLCDDRDFSSAARLLCKARWADLSCHK